VLKKVAFFLVTVAVGKEPECYSELKKTVELKSISLKQSKNVDTVDLRILEACKMIIDGIQNVAPLPTFS